jgi:hypothetical protein
LRIRSGVSIAYGDEELAPHEFELTALVIVIGGT